VPMGIRKCLGVGCVVVVVGGGGQQAHTRGGGLSERPPWIAGQQLGSEMKVPASAISLVHDMPAPMAACCSGVIGCHRASERA
jgi:hypothetical protein